MPPHMVYRADLSISNNYPTFINRRMECLSGGSNEVEWAR